jgi:hypothetical protein
MRTLTFDHWEFEPPDGEEGLEISIAVKHDLLFPSVEAFADAVYGIKPRRDLAAPVPFAEGMGQGDIRKYLKRYAGLELPTPCDWPMHIVSNDWDDFDAVLVGPTMLLRYHWSTTA